MAARARHVQQLGHGGIGELERRALCRSRARVERLDIRAAQLVIQQRLDLGALANSRPIPQRQRAARPASREARQAAIAAAQLVGPDQRTDEAADAAVAHGMLRRQRTSEAPACDGLEAHEAVDFVIACGAYRTAWLRTAY